MKEEQNIRFSRLSVLEWRTRKLVLIVALWAVAGDWAIWLVVCFVKGDRMRIAISSPF